MKLFVNPSSGVVCNKGSINYFMRKLVRMSQPGVYTSFHDLRKFSVWKAFWSNMSWSSIRARGFWRSNAALAGRYLPMSTPSSFNCVALGEVCN